MRPMRRSRISLNLTTDLHARLQALADEEDRSLSNLCIQLIQAALEQRGSGT